MPGINLSTPTLDEAVRRDSERAYLGNLNKYKFLEDFPTDLLPSVCGNRNFHPIPGSVQVNDPWALNYEELRNLFEDGLGGGGAT